VHRVAEEAFPGVLQQQAEEHLGRQLLENDLPGFDLAEYLVSGSAILLGEGFTAGVFAPGLHGSDAQTVDLLRAELQLIAELRGGIGLERALHVPLGAGGVRGVHLAIDEFRGARFQCAGAEFVGGNDA